MKSQTLLAVTFRHKNLEKLCIPNYKYIAIKNNIIYNKKETYNISSILNNIEFDTILCMNHFSVFVSDNTSDLLNLLNSEDTCIILPKIENNMPINLVPMIIKNCKWSNDFIKKYTFSNLYNLACFIKTFGLIDSPHIRYTDMISTLNTKQTIIQQQIEYDMASIKQNITKINKNLGIL